MTELPGKELEPGICCILKLIPQLYLQPTVYLLLSHQGHTQHVAQWQVSLKLFRPFGAHLSLSPDGTTPQRINIQCCFSVSPSHLFSPLSPLSPPPSLSPSLLPLSPFSLLSLLIFSPLSPFLPFSFFSSLSPLILSPYLLFPLSPTSYPLSSPLFSSPLPLCFSSSPPLSSARD